jgi:hypothetical protein
VKDGLIEFFKGESRRLGTNIQAGPEEGGGGETTGDAERNERDTVGSRGSVTRGINNTGNGVERGFVNEVSVDAARIGGKVVVDDGLVVITTFPYVRVKFEDGVRDNRRVVGRVSGGVRAEMGDLRARGREKRFKSFHIGVVGLLGWSGRE